MAWVQRDDVTVTARFRARLALYTAMSRSSLPLVRAARARVAWLSAPRRARFWVWASVAESRAKRVDSTGRAMSPKALAHSPAR